MIKQFYRFLWHLTFKKFIYFKSKYKWGKGNKIILVTKNGKKELPQHAKIKGLYIDFYGDNNIVEVNENLKLVNSSIHFKSNNNTVKFGEDVKGRYIISAYGDNSYFEVGAKTSCCDIGVSLISNKVVIGKDCMISNNVKIWGDGHSVLDATTGEVINLPNETLAVGDHVWLGERVTLLKNAKIPSNCIVGIASVVTKAFDEEKCLIAGNPAQIRKRNINWHGFPPLKLDKINKRKEYSRN